ncbi:MAG: leucine-rich repeat domain-containing protein [Opitutaceae bacterium]
MPRFLANNRPAASFRKSLGPCQFGFAFAMLIRFAVSGGYADQFGDFTYVECVTSIEITDFPDDFTGNVVIPAILCGKPVTSIGSRAFADGKLKSVVIPSSVIRVGDHAFADCRFLTSVTYYDTLDRLGSEAFGDCAMLNNIRFRRLHANRHGLPDRDGGG